jgi:putative glutamine amidotransferase
MKPIIGITPSPIKETSASGTHERYSLSSAYVNAVLAAGGIPFILAPQDGNADRILAIVDGLLFSGGADLDPAIYGDAEVHPKTYDVHPLRDRFEIELIRGAIERDIPTFCVCRGIQVLNVALGGSLYQDVSDQFDSTILHRQQEAGYESNQPSHDVAAEPESLLADTYGSIRIPVNSYHHQAVKDAAPGLNVSARSTDGLVESVEMPNRAFVLGVQWHPEMLFQEHEEHLAPFRQLIAAATSRRLAEARP